MHVHIGTSGWHYRHWLGSFYPAGTAPSGWFQVYARRFHTVELNNPFYHLPSPGVFEGWAKAAPPGFLFAVKASRYITHNKKLKDAGESFSLFFDHARHLGKKLGPILFQLPPHWGFDGGRLEEFLSLLPKHARYVFEFRNPDWLRAEAYAVLEKHRAAFCIHDMPGSQTPDQVTSDWVYVRFHGAGAKYGGNYSDAALKVWAGKIKGWSKTGKEVFCYFNNDSGGWAPRNASTLASLLKMD
jgi:uncharacterized protein YecE (DUF72 family)